MIFVYLAATEAYKWGKRVYFRRKEAPRHRGPSDTTLHLEKTIRREV